jgi:hypothetical protein
VLWLSRSVPVDGAVLGAAIVKGWLSDLIPTSASRGLGIFNQAFGFPALVPTLAVRKAY